MQFVPRPIRKSEKMFIDRWLAAGGKETISRKEIVDFLTKHADLKFPWIITDDPANRVSRGAYKLPKVATPETAASAPAAEETKN